MKFSAQEEYGLRCLLQLIRISNEKPVQVPIIAQAEGISVPYAEKLMRLLSKAGLCESVRGVKGGYRLSKPVAEITLGDVMRAFGDMPNPVEICGRHAEKHDHCRHSQQCGVRSVWNHVSDYLNGLFDSTPIASLVPLEGDCVCIDFNEKQYDVLPLA